MTTTTSQSGPVKTFDDLFGGRSSLGAANGAGSGIVLNKDSDDESEHGGGSNAVNVEELIQTSDESDGGMPRSDMVYMKIIAPSVNPSYLASTCSSTDTSISLDTASPPTTTGLKTSRPQDAESLPTSAMVLVKSELLEEDMMDITRIKKEIDNCHDMDISSGAVSKHVGGETYIEKEDSTNFSHPRIMKKDGVFTIEKKSRKHSGRRKKRKTELNFKTDNCNICKFCNVSIMIFFKLCVITAFLGGVPTNSKYYFQCDLTTTSVPLLLLWDSIHNVRASNCKLMNKLMED